MIYFISTQKHLNFITMDSNVLLSVDNHMVQKELSSIIREVILGSSIHYNKSSNVVEKIHFDFFDILIFDLKNNNEQDIDLIKKIVKLKLKTKVYVFQISL